MGRNGNIMDKTVIENNREWIDSTWEKIVKKEERITQKSRNKIPSTSVNGVHDDKSKASPECWTNGFFGGMNWILYKATGNEEYKKTAIRSEELMDVNFENYPSLHHDVGFMWHLLSGANYRITGDKKARSKNLFMAASLFSRFNIDGGYIRAWNNWNPEVDNTGWSIIDCLMNIPLLYWASDELGDKRFARVAMRHADMALRDHIRGDGSVNHIVEHDPDTGEFIRSYGGQGYGEGSCWSRGLAWAVYGMVLSYVHTGKKEYLDACKKTANYFIANCQKDDWRAVIDFMAPKEPVYYDSTAGVCAACGMLELSKYVGESEAAAYTEAAINILKATDKYFADYSDEQDALVLMGSERYPRNEAEMKCVHIPIIYGDFFYVEAITKLKGYDFLIW